MRSSVRKKRTYSTDGIVPSKEFNEEEYSLYLQYATPEELEKDKVTHTTAKRIIDEVDGYCSMIGVFYKDEKRNIIDILCGN